MMSSYGVLVYIKASDKNNEEYLSNTLQKFVEEVNSTYNENFSVEDVYYEIGKDPHKPRHFFEDGSFEKCLTLSISIGDVFSEE